MATDSLAVPFMISLGWAGLTLDTAVSFAPRATLENFFEVHSIEAERVGNTAVLRVDREIHAPINMAYTVRVMAVENGKYQQVCKASSNSFLYMPQAELPDQITLDWWTDGECPELPDGPSQIITTWDPDPQGLDALTVIAEVEE